MFLIVRLLNRASPLRLLDRRPHRIRDRICIHDNMPLGISRCSANRLNQGRFRTQESLFIRIQNRHQRNLRDIQTLTKQVDADQHIEDIQTHIPDNLGAFQRVNIRMQIFDADSRIAHIVGQVFCHPLCQRRNKHLKPSIHLPVDLRNQIVDLSLDRSHLNRRIKKSRWTDHLLCPQKLMICLILARCC